jgi:hypothetical protein
VKLTMKIHSSEQNEIDHEHFFENDCLLIVLNANLFERVSFDPFKDYIRRLEPAWIHPEDG